jgi:hypothetical protein
MRKEQMNKKIVRLAISASKPAFLKKRGGTHAMGTTFFQRLTLFDLESTIGLLLGIIVFTPYSILYQF